MEVRRKIFRKNRRKVEFSFEKLSRALTQNQLPAA
jgi:hypothetical protein